LKNYLCFFLFVLLPFQIINANELDTIIKNCIKARGGLEKISTVETVRKIGSNRLYGLDWTLMPLEIYISRKGQVRIDNYWFEGTIIQLYDSSRAIWKDPNTKKFEPMVPYQLEKVREKSDLDGYFIDTNEKGYTLHYRGKQQLPCGECFKIIVESSNVLRDVYIDSKTFFIIKEVEQRLVGGVRIEMEKYYRDYRPVKGVYFPFDIETRIDGNTNNHYIFCNIQINPNFYDSLFNRE